MAADSATALVLQTHCVRARTGLVVGGALSIGLGVMLLIIGGVLLSDGDTAIGWSLLGVGAVLLAAVVPLFRRGQLPLDLALTDAALLLTPTGRSVTFGYRPETWPLPSITGYSQLDHNGSTTLKLYLADGRVVSFGEKLAGLSGNAPGTDFVPLAELSAALQQRLETAGLPAREKPNFYQGFWGKLLAVLCALCFGAGVVMLFVPDAKWTQGLRLLTFSSIYLGAYWRNRKPARPPQ